MGELEVGNHWRVQDYPQLPGAQAGKEHMNQGANRVGKRGPAHQWRGAGISQPLRLPARQGVGKVESLNKGPVWGRGHNICEELRWC